MDKAKNLLHLQQQLLQLGRCPRCFLYDPLCICKEISALEIPFELLLVIHRSEWKKSSNSARIATLAIKNATPRVYGGKDNQSENLNFDEYACEGNSKGKTYILFPSPNAEKLSQKEFLQEFAGGTVIVPDGNWSQAKDISRKLYIKYRFPFLTLPEETITARSQYRLRSHENPLYLSTYEAITKLISVVDVAGEEKAKQLLRYFKAFVERNLLVRGLTSVERLEHTAYERGKECLYKITHSGPCSRAFLS
ncbi:MAG: DTW domain-containing protein [Oligoflexia bacterium]|nr:DTW domain-containing protein [Oligoflexia bacterium]